MKSTNELSQYTPYTSYLLHGVRLLVLATNLIMQLSQQIDRQQLQLEDIRRSHSIFARIRDIFAPYSTYLITFATLTDD